MPQGMTFEQELKVKGFVKLRHWNPHLWILEAVGCHEKTLHGEFDPGSGRTLAARLTHASRARTSPSGLGTAANG